MPEMGRRMPAFNASVAFRTGRQVNRRQIPAVNSRQSLKQENKVSLP
jgi:hypothetical protein